MPCSKCGIDGHNKRTCVSLKPVTNDCFVCYENVSELGQVTTPCGHTYCISCFVQHTQINNADTCGYCRTKLELPRKPSVALSEIKRREIINNCISNYDIYVTIYTDLYRQMRTAIDSHPTLATSGRMTEICKEVLKEVSLDFGLCVIGMKVADAVIEELA